MIEKKEVVIEGTVKDGGPSKVEEPKRVVNEKKLENGRSVYSTLGFDDLMAEVKTRGLKSKARGLTDSEKGRRTLRDILKEDDAEKKVKAHLSETKTQKEVTLKGIPRWVWALIILVVALLLWGIFRPHPTASVNLAPIQTGIENITASVAGVDQKVSDLTGRVIALEQAVITEPDAATVVEVPSAVEPVTEPSEPKIPDTVNHFYNLDTFYIDGDPDVEGYKVQGATMKYVCKNDFGVFITMDPGVVNGQSTGDLGAVFYVACNKGDVVTLSTPHWSTSALHQQIHLVEFTQEISEKQAAEFLKVLKIDEGKEIAFFIDSEGKITKY